MKYCKNLPTEIEYKLGVGKEKFDDARLACQGLDKTSPADRGGWDLAIIPTHMHNLEVNYFLAFFSYHIFF